MKKSNFLSSFSIFYIALFSGCFINLCPADSGNVQDTCPTAPMLEAQKIFMNGLPCKPPNEVISSDFKSSKLSTPGDTDNFRGSAVTILTATEFPGLNTLGLSVARTDLAVDGLVAPHSHPRASEMLYVYKGAVLAGFVDTSNQLFQKFLGKGDVMVFPRGLLHFCLNAGFEEATLFSVLNSQNAGVVSISDALFKPEHNRDMAMVTGWSKRLMNFMSRFNSSMTH